jgi:mRNA interferase MazF
MMRTLSWSGDRSMVKRGEIWLVNLDPTVGGEIQKTRPCVIISPPEMHDHLRKAIIAPMATGSRPALFRIAVSHAGKSGLILLDQIRAVDQSRLVKRGGTVDAATLKAVLEALGNVFAE